MLAESVGTGSVEMPGASAPAGAIQNAPIAPPALACATPATLSEAASTQGIVLAGSFPWSDSPLDRLLPRPLLPVAHQPLISYALRWLRQGGVRDVVVCLNKASRAARVPTAESGRDFRGLEFHEDLLPRGPAGCARDAALATSADTFVVADGTAIPSVALADLLQSHRASGAVATVLVQQGEHHHGASLSRPGGLYVFERRALELVSARGFQDIKENLIPQLHRAGEHVAAYLSTAGNTRVLNAATYLEVNGWAVSRLVGREVAPAGYELAGDALIHVTASVDPGARMVGPVLIGPDSKVMEGATVVGPVVVGSGCTVAADAVVSRTVAWNRCTVGPKAIVDGCVLAEDVVVEPNSRLCGEVSRPARRRDDLARVAGARAGSAASSRATARSTGAFVLLPQPAAR